MQNTINERINLIIKTLNLKQSEFSLKTGIKERTLSNLVNSSTTPSYESIVGILKAFPFVKADWLILGEGEINFPNDIKLEGNYSDNNVKNKRIEPNPERKFPLTEDGFIDKLYFSVSVLESRVLLLEFLIKLIGEKINIQDILKELEFKPFIFEEGYDFNNNRVTKSELFKPVFNKNFKGLDNSENP